MVATPPDPVRIPTISLSISELEDLQAEIDAGRLPKDYIKRYFVALRNNVFGDDHKLDKDGRPIEQGLGSAVNQTRQSIDAYKRFHKDDLNFKESLELIEKQYAACRARKPADLEEVWAKHRGAR